MRLELRRSGGIAGPIRRSPVVLETDGLDDQACARVDRAVAAARSRGSDLPAERPRGADLLQYRVRIEGAAARGTDRGAETLTFSDPVDDPALGSLIELINELGKEQPDG